MIRDRIRFFEKKESLETKVLQWLQHPSIVEYMRRRYEWFHSQVWDFQREEILSQCYGWRSSNSWSRLQGKWAKQNYYRFLAKYDDETRRAELHALLDAVLGETFPDRDSPDYIRFYCSLETIMQGRHTFSDRAELFFVGPREELRQSLLKEMQEKLFCEKQPERLEWSTPHCFVCFQRKIPDAYRSDSNNCIACFR